MPRCVTHDTKPFSPSHCIQYTLYTCVQWTSCSSSTSSSTSGPPTSTTRKSPEWIADRLLFRNLANKALQKSNMFFLSFQSPTSIIFVIARTIFDAHFRACKAWMFHSTRMRLWANPPKSPSIISGKDHVADQLIYFCFELGHQVLSCSLFTQNILEYAFRYLFLPRWASILVPISSSSALFFNQLFLFVFFKLTFIVV